MKTYIAFSKLLFQSFEQNKEESGKSQMSDSREPNECLCYLNACSLYLVGGGRPSYVSFRSIPLKRKITKAETLMQT